MMNRALSAGTCLFGLYAIFYGAAPAVSAEIEPLGSGPYSVGSTNLEVAPEYVDIGDEAMHEYLPAMKHLSGPTYVVELIDQPHVFEEGSWQERDNWELLFFSAYLQNNAESLATLKTARSMKGGNDDIQLFDYQK